MYVKGNFLPVRHFLDRADLNAQARDWGLQVAEGRRIAIHGRKHDGMWGRDSFS